MTSYQVESPYTEGLSKIRACRNGGGIHGDIDGPVIAAREGRKLNRRSGSPSTNIASERRRRHERSASPSRTNSTARRQRRERSPVNIKIPSPRWEQDFELQSHNLLLQCTAKSQATGPNRQEEHGKEGNKEDQISLSFKLVERLLKNVAAGATLLPSWDEHLKMMVECTEQELATMNVQNEPVTSGSGLWTHELQSNQGVHSPEVSEQQEPEVANLINPLSSFHISEPSSDTDSGSSGLVSPVEDGGNTIPPELADVTLKPAIWGEHEVEAEYTDDDDEEDEENILGPYDPPTYCATPSSPQCQVRARGYQRKDTVSRYWKPGKGNRFEPYHPRARPEPHSSPDAYATGAPESSGRITVGSIILAAMKKDMARESSDVDCSGRRPLSGGKNYWSPLTQRKGMDGITHKFKKLVLGV